MTNPASLQNNTLGGEGSAILIVDDTPATVGMVANVLSGQGYRVRQVSSGPLALRSAADNLPDLILLNVRIPELDGYEVCRRLKADPRTDSVPVIFISALPEAKEKVRGFAIGAVDYISKPFEPEELVTRVRIHLELSHLQQRLEQRVEARTSELATANRALQQSEERLRSVIEATSDGVWEWNLRADGMLFSDRWYSMLDYAPGEFGACYTSWRERVHPDDLGQAEATVRAHLHNQLSEFSVEYRMRAKGGDWKWINSRGRVITRDEAGDPLRMVGTNIDITSRKGAEIALRESEARLRTAIESIPFDFFIIGGNGRYVLQNSVCKKHWGDVVGKCPEEVANDAEMLAHWNSNNRRAFSGEIVEAEVRLTVGDEERCIHNIVAPVRDGDKIWGIVGLNIDITDRKRAEEAVRHREEQYRAVIETSPDGFWIADLGGRLLEASEAYARLSGYSRDELRGMRISELEANESPADVADHIERIARQGNDLFRTQHRAKSGRVWQAEMNISYWPIAGGRLFAFIRDIDRRQRAEALLHARMRLSERAMTGSLDDVLRSALDEAERFTGSQIGFFHFFDSDQEKLTAQAWSARVLRNACSTQGKAGHHPVSQAGVWADSVRQRKPMIHNDYARLSHGNGLPEGHPPLNRELTVPILRNDLVVGIIGVGNKPEEYTEDDVEVIGQLADLVLDVVDRKRSEDRIAHLAYHDALTQLPNRVLLTDRLLQGTAKAQRDQTRFAVCYLDLDEFKPINDTWGHDQGDRILVQVAHRLTHCVRAGDTVARLGGDEFVLLLENLSGVEECEHALDRVLAALQAPFEVASQSVTLRASLGVTLYPDDDSDPDGLLRHTDQAMYVAKQAGGRQYHWFDAEHDRRARAHRELLQRVEAGLARGEFRLHYQPKVDMRTGEVVGAEALIRWQNPDEGLLAPAHFMSAVETSDLCIALDRWVVGEALRQMATWADQGLSLPVSVNISGHHLQQPTFVAGLRSVLAAHSSVPPGWLQLEILETAALHDLEAISRLIEGCRQLGVRFALDDFGTGYSSLTYLKHLPVQVLKIDQSFVRDLLVDADARSLVEGIIGLSNAFRREVIAEGVETDDHGRQLIVLGCNLAQGYGISRPIPAEDIPAWIASWKPPAAWLDGAY